VADLEGTSAADIAVLSVVTLPRGAGELPTANLQGPLAINLRARLAKQVICEDRDYGVRHPVDLLKAVA
jgi:flagellar assembly factor FliW